MEDNQMDGKYLIGDSIDIVCKYLDLKTLYNVAQVCKSWRDAAWREKVKRFHIYHYRLPYEISNVASKLNTGRFASLVIYDLKFHSENFSRENWEDPENRDFTHRPEEQMVKLLKLKRLHKTIILMVDDYVTTNEIKYHGARDKHEFFGYFFPHLERRTQINIACIPNFEPEEMDMQVDRFGEDLGFDNSDYPKSTLLLFINNRQTLHADDVIRKLQKRVHIGEHIIWSGLFGKCVRMADCLIEDFPRTKYWQDFIAIRISGPTVESWTTFIHCLSESSVVERKLQALKRRVKPKRYYAGFVYSRKCYEEGCTHESHPCCDSYEIMRYVNRIFPNVPFVGLFQNAIMNFLSAERNSYGKDDGYYLFLYTSIIIISYD